MILQFPVEPMSVNQMYSSFKGKRFVSPKGRAFKKDMAVFMPKIYLEPNFVVIKILKKFKGDIDNYIKAILDSLVTNKVIWDDRNITAVCCIRAKTLPILKTGPCYIQVHLLNRTYEQIDKITRGGVCQESL